jgi:hypothetical protein
MRDGHGSDRPRDGRLGCAVPLQHALMILGQGEQFESQQLAL